MTRKHGYTLVEIIIVSALASVALSLVYTLYIYFFHSTNTETAEQLYFRKLTALESRVRQDLRAAIEVKKEADGVYSVIASKLDQAMNPGTEEIIYWVDEGGRGVQRHVKSTGDVNQFDFSGLIPEGESFIFSIK